MDLWTHDDTSNHIPMGAKETGSPPALRSTRRLTDRAILALFRNWLLQDYASTYARALSTTRIFRRCYWVDGLGGFDARSLQCPPDEQAEAQKPVRKKHKARPPALSTLPPALQAIAALSQELSQQDQPITLQGLLLARGSSQRKHTYKNKQQRRQFQAQDTPAQPSIPGEGGIIPASWLDIATPLLQEIEQSPAIFLLNPLGPTMFSYDDLLPLYQRTVPTELLLLIAHKQIESALQEAAKATTGAAALTALLRSDRWKTLPRDGETAITGFLQLFRASMQRHFQWSPQLIQISVHQGPASTTTIPYTLLYATRRQDSLLSMNDAICLYQRQTVRQSYRGVLSEEWFIKQGQEKHNAELQMLSRQLYQQGTALQTRRWPDLRQHLLQQNFGRYTRQEYDTSIKLLIERGEVNCIWRRPAKPGEEQIPGNDDTLRWR